MFQEPEEEKESDRKDEKLCVNHIRCVEKEDAQIAGVYVYVSMCVCVCVCIKRVCVCVWFETARKTVSAVLTIAFPSVFISSAIRSSTSAIKEK